MTTTETNKLIAEFIGYENPPYYMPENAYFNLHGRKDWFSAGELKYHTSWDWLMPVVEKIKDMGYDQELDKIDNALACDLRIDRLYNEVVRFIKYHDQQKDLPDTM